MKFSYFVLSVLFLFAEGCSAKTMIPDDSVLKLDAVAGTITQAGDKIIYSGWDTSIRVYDLVTHATVFSRKIDAICYAKPLLKAGKIYYPSSNEKFVCIQNTTGAILWQLDLKGRCSNFDFIDDSTIVASVKHYGLLGVNANNGKIVYELKYDYAESELPDLSPWPVAYDNEKFYVSNWQGKQLSAYDKKSGSLRWIFKDSSFGAAGRCMVHGTRLFIGVNHSYQSGKLFVLDANDGRILTEKACSYEDRVDPVAYVNSICFYSYDRTLKKFDFNTNEVATIKRFEQTFDISGNQLFLVRDTIFFSDASFYTNSYSIPENKFVQLQRTQKPLTGAFEFKGKVYFIY